MTIPQFIAHAERVSGQHLDALFDAWLFTGERPEVSGALARRSPVDLPPLVGAQRPSHG